MNRPRGAKPMYTEIAALNSSGRPQLDAALDFCRKKRNQRGGGVGALLAQEHHLVGTAWADAKVRAKRGGWRLSGCAGEWGPCETSASGRKGTVGVGVAVRSVWQSGKAETVQIDLSPTESPGRLSSTFVDGIIRGGVLLISVYLYHTEGATPRNLDLLEAAALAIKRWGGAWVMGG